MFEITEAAQKQLEGYFQDKDPSPIRVYLASGGWAGPRLTLALDEPNDQDAVYETAGFTFVIDKDLESQVGDVKVDMTYYGFVVESANPVASEGSSCSCSSSGSCGSAGSGSCGC